LEGVLMGRTTFEPALGADRWPWPELDVFVLGSHRPSGTPDEVVVESDPERLLERLREANEGGDVHLVGGPTTIESFRRLGALDRLGLLVLPVLIGEGMRLTPALSTDTGMSLESERSLDEGAVELVYAVR
jgi:dihydrofolate reductase